MTPSKRTQASASLATGLARYSACRLENGKAEACAREQRRPRREACEDEPAPDGTFLSLQQETRCRALPLL